MFPCVVLSLTVLGAGDGHRFGRSHAAQLVIGVVKQMEGKRLAACLCIVVGDADRLAQVGDSAVILAAAQQVRHGGGEIIAGLLVGELGVVLRRGAAGSRFNVVRLVSVRELSLASGPLLPTRYQNHCW